MNRTRILFFLGLIGMTFLIVRCNSTQDSSKPPTTARRDPLTIVPPPAASPSPKPTAPVVAAASPSATPSATPPPATAAVDMQKVAQGVSRSVVLISAFDQKGKLLRTGSGCFISDDGRILTSASITENAANAVAKADDGKIYNIAGILGESSSADLAVLKAETEDDIAVVTPNKAATAVQGARVAIVGSPETKRKPPHIEATVAARRDESLELKATIPAECIGAPVVNDRGELVGVVSAHHSNDGTIVARGPTMIENVISRIDPKAAVRWAVNVAEPPPPGEGPTGTPKPKVPLAGQGQSRLIYSPKPTYPLQARMSHFPVRGTGKYRVDFDDKGEVRDVSILQSARSDTLDQAATDALRRWKATPGKAWSATVPITFQP